ncbi:hypothetical protein P6144_05505 [Sphingomonas sp. HITSZ_GF]|uniref:hypothetical protein n=1 Tax=Sphingomonas sp. HITSZ_GF TaxID=3037247 RepID=UPI00240E055A|nr:hypothetical protein [Sphingomonas sp. HITSZ_GF]MDG2533094.1 hypothetical protein [Sphingomonas sp. HITSZ_GF]
MVRSFRVIVATALFCALAPQAALAKESAFSASLPSVDKLVSDYDRDPARVAAACEVVRSTMLALAQDIFTNGTPERKRFLAYENCRDFDHQPLVPSEVKVRSFQNYTNPDFQREVARRYLSSADYARWEASKQSEWETTQSLTDSASLFGLIALAPLLFFLLIPLFFVWRALRPWRYDPETGTLRVGGRTFTFYRKGGVVAQSAASTSTHHVAGTQTVATNQYGHSHVVSSTPGYSYTTLHETIHMLDKSGREHAIRLDDWSISARGGHLIGLMHVIRKGRTTGPYIRVWNYTLDEMTSASVTIRKMFGLGFLGWAGLAAALYTAIFLVSAVFAATSASADRINIMGSGMFFGLLLAVVVATIVHLRVRQARIVRFNQEISSPIRDAAYADARAASDRTLGPISRAD